MDYQSFAEKTLKDNGYRVTVPRKTVIAQLAKAKRAYNAYHIVEQAGNLDVVTVYRILDVLTKLSLVHKSQNGYRACSTFSCRNKDHCHHQFTCNTCQETYEFHVDDRDFIKKISKQLAGHMVSGHYFELEGTCKSCIS